MLFFNVQTTIKTMKKVYLFGLLFVLWSCNNENLSGGTPPQNSGETQQTRMTLMEARVEVEKLLGQIDRDITRSGSRAREISDYFCVGESISTRSSESSEREELTTYVFNFADNNGFAIVAGDKRISAPILVLTDEGHLNPKEEVENPWLATYLILADNYCKTEIAMAEVETRGQARITPPWEWDGDWYVKETLGRRTNLNWHQGAPFNNNIPPINGQVPPLGCTATATMLLMAWYQYPQVYNGYRYNWTEMLKHRNTATNGGQENDVAKVYLARLSEIITRKENLDMTFGPTSSGAWLYNIPRTLKNLGYFHGGTHAEWNLTIVLDELKNYPHYPVAVSAYAHSTDAAAGGAEPTPLGIPMNAPTGYTSGHSFLLECAMIRERKIKYLGGVYYPGLKVKQETLVYVNYGWKGNSYNGYYNAGVFNADAGPVMRSESPNYFQYWINMVYGVRI